eukprot:1420919-Prymnesium_polylepis.1
MGRTHARGAPFHPWAAWPTSGGSMAPIHMLSRVAGGGPVSVQAAPCRAWRSRARIFVCG